MDEEADPQHREHDKPERQLQNGIAIPQEAFLWNAPAIEEQKRRQEQKKENLRLQFDMGAGDRTDGRPQNDLHERQRHRPWRHTRNSATGDHRQQQNEDDGNCLHALSRAPRLGMPLSPFPVLKKSADSKAQGTNTAAPTRAPERRSEIASLAEASG